MNDQARAAPLVSPCVGICRMSDDGGHCTGCLRSIDEIAAWSGASDTFKREVWRQLAERRKRLGPLDQ